MQTAHQAFMTNQEHGPPHQQGGIHVDPAGMQRWVAASCPAPQPRLGCPWIRFLRFRPNNWNLPFTGRAGQSPARPLFFRALLDRFFLHGMVAPVASWGCKPSHFSATRRCDRSAAADRPGQFLGSHRGQNVMLLPRPPRQALSSHSAGATRRGPDLGFHSGHFVSLANATLSS